MEKERMRQRKNIVGNHAAFEGGFSLIELLVGISVLTVVGLMITSLFGSSTRLYRSTISYSNIQTESQTVSRRLSNAIMSAKSLYLKEEDTGLCLFTGKPKNEMGKTIYSGEIFWLNKETNCLYQDSSFFAEESGSEGDEASDFVPLKLETVKNAFEENESRRRQYLISDKVTDMEFLIGSETVNFGITFQYLDSKTYSVNTSATPRNRGVLPRSGSDGDSDD